MSTTLILRGKHSKGFALISTNGYILGDITYSEGAKSWYLKTIFDGESIPCKSIRECIDEMNNVLNEFMSGLSYSKTEEEKALDAYYFAKEINENSKLSLNEKYDNIIGIYKGELSYYDPDSGYQEDIDAYIEALKEKAGK